jgi:hypothetical protein
MGERVLNNIGGHHAKGQESNELASILIEIKLNRNSRQLQRFYEELYSLLHKYQIPYIEKHCESTSDYEIGLPSLGKTLLKESQVAQNTLTPKNSSNAAPTSRPSRIHSQFPYILCD